MSFYAELAALERARRPFVLATVTDTGGSTPQLAGAQMAVCADTFYSTVGGGFFEQRVIETARALLANPARRVDEIDVHLVRDLGMCCGGRMKVFMQKVTPAPRLRVYGAGHVGTALVKMAELAGFEVTVVDGRSEWADAARFPEAVTVADEEPEDHLRAQPPAADEHLVVVTHSHPLDEALVRMLAADPPGYVGVIGSRAKWARFVTRLTARGVDAAWLETVRCPMGLDIGAVTPEEIAVSVVAELVAHHRARGPSQGF